MSYILDAIRKAEQERQRGHIPTLQQAPPSEAGRRPTPYLWLGVAATLLLAVGIIVGGLRPWRDAPPPVAAAPIQVQPPPPQPVPVAPVSPVQVTVISPPAVASAPPVVPALPPTPSLAQAVAAPPAIEAKAPPATPIEKPMPEAIAIEALPPTIREEVPAMTMQLHAYSSTPKDRLVSVNNKLLREGDNLATGLKLEYITSDGMIFSYKGYVFKRGM